MALLKSAHGGNIREAAALLGIAPNELLDFSANINPLGMPASLRQAIVDNPAAPSAILTSNINSCTRRWRPPSAAGGAYPRRQWRNQIDLHPRPRP